MTVRKDKLLIGIVGPCAAGKSTLLNNLHAVGIEARHIAQEHSYVPDMWKKITDPDILVYLDVSYSLSKKRRSLDWTVEDYEEQHHRLRHARLNADLYIHTDELTPAQVMDLVMEHISSNR